MKNDNSIWLGSRYTLRITSIRELNDDRRTIKICRSPKKHAVNSHRRSSSTSFVGMAWRGEERRQRFYARHGNYNQLKILPINLHLPTTIAITVVELERERNRNIETTTINSKKEKNSYCRRLCIIQMRVNPSLSHSIIW